MFLSKIKHFFTRNKKFFLYVGFFFLIYFISGEVGFAKTPGDEWKQDAVDVVNWLVLGISTLVGAMTYFITLFLEPGWINGTLFGLDSKFREIWILVSNIVYFIFAGILIWIAFMNIIGKGEKWELKQALPKFIIGVLIVPFSWFFVQFILSISAILTVSSLSLPYDTFDDYKIEMDNVKIKPNCVIDLSFNSSNTNNDKKSSETEKENKNNKFFDCTGNEVQLGETLKQSSFGLVSMYTYGILKLENIENLLNAEFKLEKIQNIGDLIVKVVFNLLFVVVYMVLLISLGIVLAVRGMYIWIYTMLSPVFGLMYFFDKNDGGGDGFFSKFNLKEFISLSLVPVFVTLALSFGLLFIHTISTGINKTDISSTGKVKITKGNDGGELNKIEIGDVSLTIKGPVGTYDSNENSPLNVIAVGSNGVLGTVGTLILYFMGIAVFRISIMAALRSSDITKTVVEPIYQFGNNVGSLISKSPQYAPIFGGMSMESMKKVSTMPASALETRAANKASPYQEHINKAFGVQTVDAGKQAKLKNMYRNGIDSEPEFKEAQSILRDLIKAHGTNNSTIQELVKNYAQALKDGNYGQGMGVGDDDIKNLFDASGKISKEGYAMLFHSKDKRITAVDGGKASAWAAAHINANSEYKESQEGETSENVLPDDVLKELEKSNVGKSKTVKFYTKEDDKTNKYKIIVKSGDEHITSNIRLNAKSQNTAEKVLENMGPQDETELKNILTKLDITDVEGKDLIKEVFTGLKKDEKQVGLLYDYFTGKKVDFSAKKEEKNKK